MNFVQLFAGFSPKIRNAALRMVGFVFPDFSRLTSAHNSGEGDSCQQYHSNHIGKGQPRSMVSEKSMTGTSDTIDLF
jgi:hypothetical protein